VDGRLLHPREMWDDRAEYDRVYAGLAEKFKANFGQFRNLVRPEVAQAGP
jgi:ATP-dependent phosphoenolpyruvate carboxykinase